MKTIWLCKADIQREVESQVRPEYLQIHPGTMVFQVGLEVDDALEKKISTDDLLANKIFDGVSEIYKDTLTRVVNVTEGFDKRIKAEHEGLDPDVDLVIWNHSPKSWQCVVNSYLEHAKDRMIEHARRQIEFWKQTRQDRTAYVVREVINVSSGLVILTANITSAAFGGGVLSILGAVKSFVKLLQETWMLLRKVGAQERELYTHLSEIVNAYERGFGATKEVLASAATEVTAGLLPGVLEFFSLWSSSISQVESDLRIFHEKLAGLEIDASEAGRKLNQLLDDQSRQKEPIQAAVDHQIEKRLLSGNSNYESKRLNKLRANLRTLESDTNEKITEMESMYRLIQGFKEREKTYSAALEELKAKRTGSKATVVRGFELLFKVGDMIVDSSVGTDYSKTTEILQLVTSIETDSADLIADEYIVGAGSPA